MSERPIKVNWNLFKIVRKQPVAKDAPQIAEPDPTPVPPQIVSLPWVQATSPPLPKVRRIPAPDEPLAFCAKCGDWTPMLWLPMEERGRAAETWFECEYCGCRELKLRYVVRAI
jgi:hypothetical protein